MDRVEGRLGGDDERFLSLFREQSGDSASAQAFTKQLLDDRNVGMTQKIQDYLASSGTYFVLAGAAHFVGENGIVELLRRQDIHGRRINSAARLQAAQNHQPAATQLLVSSAASLS